jgi:hypothetical protein
MMTRPTNIAKPRLKPSTVFYGLYLCWNNRHGAYGVTIEEAYRNWELGRHD